MDAGCECAPSVRSANPSDSWALVQPSVDLYLEAPTAARRIVNTGDASGVHITAGARSNFLSSSTTPHNKTVFYQQASCQRVMHSMNLITNKQTAARREPYILTVHSFTYLDKIK